MKQRDKKLLLILVILLVGLIFKSTMLDEYIPINDMESNFKENVEKEIGKKYNNILYSNKILFIRIIDISEMSENDKTVKDSDGNSIILDGIYKAKIRKYILGFLPFSDEKVLDFNLK